MARRLPIKEAAQSPLGFLVLVILLLDGYMIFLLRGAVEFDRRVLTYGVFVSILVVVGVVVWLAVTDVGTLLGVRRSDHAVLIGSGGKGLPAGFDISVIDWDDKSCRLIAGTLKAPIQLCQRASAPVSGCSHRRES